ncbi:MAG: hypothetical protein V3T65_01675, partial [Acidobacteriota bacterium]
MGSSDRACLHAGQQNDPGFALQAGGSENLYPTANKRKDVSNQLVYAFEQDKVRTENSSLACEMRHCCKWKSWFTTGSPVVGLLCAMFLAGLGLSSAISSALPHPALTQPAQTENSGMRVSIEGRVVFTGKTIPHPTVIENGTDPQSCGIEQSFEDLL